MKTYRYGHFENILGESYVIQRKTWFGWMTIHDFGSRSKMTEVANQLKEKGYIVYEV